jgi:hypothetical protein
MFKITRPRISKIKYISQGIALQPDQYRLKPEYDKIIYLDVQFGSTKISSNLSGRYADSPNLLSSFRAWMIK